jgi:hypothetical protein
MVMTRLDSDQFGTTVVDGTPRPGCRGGNVNYIDYGTCNNLYEGALVGSVMFCAGVWRR